jgi:hypothetical protein
MLGALLLCSVSNAQIDTWIQDKSDDGSYVFAAVVNSDGGIFGEFCYYASKNCFWQMTVETGCTANATAPVLVNTDTGTAALTVQCFGAAKNGSYRYKFNWKSLESTLKGSNSLGIAMGLQANGFKVYRFNLDGMALAQSKLETQFFAAVKPSQPGPKPASEML